MSALAMFAMIGAMSLTSCSDDEDNGGSGGGSAVNPEAVELKGTIEGTMNLDANKEYHLTGTLNVPAGATLNIPAGTVIKAAQGFSNYIIVEQGGKIYANGTADKPIVFTADSEDATSGYWGGLIINGKAPITGGGTAGTEVSTNIPYGGDDAADNSGVIKYVELWYTGAKSSADIEHNGLTLNGVGNGTEIDNVYIVEGADDGGQPVSETGAEDDDQVEHVVHERSGRQFLCAVVSDHERVGQAQDDDADLPDDDGDADGEKPPEQRPQQGRRSG